ncbi:MAG: phytoene/squalene synthase family protein [candidate division WOR-3 bacterium]|nr:phytoene/squalene synthase family protein [candidate division WOR-3 bacterium]MCX7947164.1 phytoene/squalene synthase family protein [candidate division WOR-3 bacterium]MDW8150220.1 phytoene/squalene synthase family protein [candidate division WOR-3 bacterium]
MVEYFRKCEEIMKQNARTFYLASLNLPIDLRKHFWSIYAYCRLVDNIADEFFIKNDRKSSISRIYEIQDKLLSSYENKYKGNEYVFLALKDTFSLYRFDIGPFLELLKGALWDIEGKVIENMHDLFEYSKLVAGSVGAMLIPIISDTEEDIKEKAYNYGIFMQIVNILRDVGEDYKLRKRVYIPKSILNEFGIKEFQIKNEIITPNYVDMLEFLMEIAESLYHQTVGYVKYLRKEVRDAILSAGTWYLEILNAIRFNKYDNFKKRAYVNRVFKIISKLGGYHIRKSVLKKMNGYRYFKFYEVLDLDKGKIVEFHSDFKNANVNLPFGKLTLKDSKIESEKIIDFKIEFGIFKISLKLYILDFNSNELCDSFLGFFHVHRFYDGKIIEIFSYRGFIPKFLINLFFEMRYRRLKRYAYSKYILKGL